MPHKTVISPGQGLLILMDHYQHDADKVARLKKLYLCGAENPTEADELKNILKDKALSSYQISYDAKTINDDPTRRYFETHLSYETLTHGIDKIDSSDLKKHSDNLMSRLPREKLSTIEHVLRGEFREKDNNLFKEYADAISKIKSGAMFPNLSQDQRDKVELLVKSSFLGVVNAWYTRMPLNIYGTGIYSEENKGKKMVEGQETTRNVNLGIMKGHMPLARDDLARGETEIPYLKPTDQATFVEHAKWVELNFNKLVHPYSNSISGTMLCQLRALAQLRNEDRGVFTESAEKLSQFSQLLTSAMLFNSGGHTLNEFTTPLTIHPVREEFKSLAGFEHINLESMYLRNNEAGFNQALQDTINYNKMILMRSHLHAQITGQTPIEPSNAALSTLKFSQEKEKLIEKISEQKERYDQRVKGQAFSSLRAGVKKNELIQVGLNKAITHLQEGNIVRAQEAITSLKNAIEHQFGKTNLFGQTSESYKLIDSIENELSHCHHNLFDFKRDIRDLREVSVEPSQISGSSLEQESEDEGEGEGRSQHL